MKKLFSSLFAGAASSAPPPAAQPAAAPEQEQRPLAHYLALTVRGAGALTPRGEAVVMDFLNAFPQAPGQLLSAAHMRAKEAADLELDIRAAELLRTPLTPRRSLSAFAGELQRSALLQKARHDAVVQMRAFCTEMTLTPLGAGDECDWCRANEGKRFPVAEDPNALLERHCTCAPYPSATFHPAIPAFDA